MADYTPEFYEDDDGSEPVLDWLRGLPAYKRRAAVAAIEHILARHGAGVCGTSWGKWVQGVKGSIFELRVRQDYGAVLRDAGVPPPEVSADAARESHSDILLRVFCHVHGEKVVLLLAGYDKGKDPSANGRTRKRSWRTGACSGSNERRLAPNRPSVAATAQENAALDEIWGTPHNSAHDRAVPTKQETH